MLPSVPSFLSLAFGLVTALAIGLLYYASHRSGRTLFVLLMWLLVQGACALSGFYTVATGWPPRLALLLLPPGALLLALVGTARGRRYLDGLHLATLTLLHVVRLPVELVLFGLYLHQAVPREMTFAGRNWDILMGLSAPAVYYFVRRQRLGTRGLLLWNVVGLGLLFHIVVTAVLSAPSPFQRLAFEQPNVAILYFPFNWLPALVVPVVLLAHMAAIRQLLLKSGTPVAAAGPPIGG
ncbi:hypothetical protein GO988_06140 [Hymenobacter sp. HMF4947]|uniref:Uncharacterized protein n=1 Tax=Hymenobacter ginkgonis TaxID=2682976 RepID=A0A7K1TC55_9BACT|nr:hypothetical protein [Hymenobacter ginkgonis]MVN75902.1 hypothetical protein [Hymenobacter ginkgonis]